MQESEKHPLKIFDIPKQHPVAMHIPDKLPKETTSDVSFDSTQQRRGCAALEVDRFAWPPLCKALEENANTIAAPIVESILNSSAAGKRIILIASGIRQSGRTTMAIWLAATCARTNQRIALIDADVENPSIAQLLGVQPVAGWELFSARDQSIDEYLIDSIADRYTILPCTDNQSPSDWPHSWDLASILEGLRDHYDAVLVDMPPLSRKELGGQMLDDCAPFVDAALWLDTSPTDTRWALKQFQTAGVQMLGLVQRAQLAARAA